jgi:uncharacterized membrane protein YeaQ/YmgE (transglycosylase-associated protein family)
MTFAMVVMWVLGGLLAGGLAGFVLRRGGYGLVTDIGLGLGGGLAATALFRILGIAPEAGLFAVVIVAFVGAAGVLVAQRQIWPTVA